MQNAEDKKEIHTERKSRERTIKNGKRVIHDIFLAMGFGTAVFVPMLILDSGLNETLKSVCIWTGASVLYGASFGLLRTNAKHKRLLHIAVCFAVTIGTRFLYSYAANGKVAFGSILAVTVPIFAVVYFALCFFMKAVGGPEEERNLNLPD